MKIKRRAAAFLLCMIMILGMSAACILPESALAAVSAENITAQSAEILMDHVEYNSGKKPLPFIL